MNIKLYSGVSKDMRRKTFTRTTLYVAVGVFLILGVTGAVNIANTSSAAAESIDWMSDGVSVVREMDRSTDVGGVPPNHVQACTHKSVQLDKVELFDACVYQAKSFSLARETVCQPNLYGSCNYQTSMLIGFNDGNRMYRIDGLLTMVSWVCWQVSPETNRLVVACGGAVGVIDDLVANLTKTSDFGGDKYQFNPDNLTYLRDSRDWVLRIDSAAMSKNGKWLIGEATNHGLIRVNLEDSSVRMFLQTGQYTGYGMDPTMEFAVTGDGQYVAAGGWNNGATMYKIDDSCGRQASVYLTSWNKLDSSFTSCPSKDISAMLMAANGPTSGFRAATYPSFSDDSGQLELLYSPYTWSDDVYQSWMTLTADNYTAGSDLPMRFGYLAMGDSYSSGEGDVGKGEGGNRYYALNAQGIVDACHVSPRSY
ncbi:MAG: hypothetical protein ABI303_01885, partial [Candidatus Saccharimonas sp.]